MKSVFVLLILSIFTNAQTTSIAPDVKDTERVSVTISQSPDPDFVVEKCYWYIYEQGKPKEKPITIEGCGTFHHIFPEGTHAVELVVNGKQKKFAHLSLEQRRFTKTVIIQPRVVAKTPGT